MSKSGSTFTSVPLFRQAAAAIDRGRRRVLEAAGIEDMFPGLNTTITIKATPSKTIEELEKVSLKSGKILKRNKQLEWHERYCLIVPHTFLYYFSEDDCSWPHGVIDLELYSEIDILEGNVLRLHTPDYAAESSLLSPRDLYFCFRNTKEASDWMELLSPSSCKFRQLASNYDLQTKLCRDLEMQSIELHQEIRSLQMHKDSLSLELQQRTNLDNKITDKTLRLLSIESPSGFTITNAFEMMQENITALRQELKELTLEAKSKVADSATHKYQLVQQQAEELADLKNALKNAQQKNEDMAVERQTLIKEMQRLQIEIQNRDAEVVEAKTNMKAVVSECRDTQSQLQQNLAQRKLIAREFKAMRNELLTLRDEYSQLEQKYQYLLKCSVRSHVLEEDEREIEKRGTGIPTSDLRGVDSRIMEESNEAQINKWSLVEWLISKENEKERTASASDLTQSDDAPSSIDVNRTELSNSETASESVEREKERPQIPSLKPLSNAFSSLIETASTFAKSSRREGLLNELNNADAEEASIPSVGISESTSPPKIEINLSSSIHGSEEASELLGCYAPTPIPDESWRVLSWRQLLDRVTNATQEGGNLSSVPDQQSNYSMQESLMMYKHDTISPGQ